VAGFFLLISFCAQVPWFAEKIGENKIAEKIPAEISSEYSKTKHADLGQMGKGVKIAKVEKEPESY